MRKKILAVLTAVALMVAMVVSLPSVTTWADELFDMSTHHISASPGGASAEVWGPGDALMGNSGSIPSGSKIYVGTGIAVNPVGIEPFSTSVTDAAGNTLYILTSPVNYSIVGLDVNFTMGSEAAGAAGEVEGAGATAGFSPEQIAWAQYHDHAHNSNDTGFGFIVKTPVSEYSDGWEVYGCPECGYKEYSSPISAFDFFNDITAQRIRVAKPGQTIEIEAGQWISFQKVLIDALKMKADDITVVIRYKYQGQLWTLTIPRGTDYSNVPDDKCIGLVNLGGCLKQDAVAKY